MEAVAMDIKPLELDQASEVQETNKDEPEKTENTFFSILKNLTSRLEREKLQQNVESSEETETLNKANLLRFQNEKRSAEFKVTNEGKKEKQLANLEYSFDEEVKLSEMFSNLENAEATVLLSPIRQLANGETSQEANLNLKEKSLLQSLMERDATAENDELLLKELVDRAEKQNAKLLNDAKVKKFTNLASVRLNKQAESRTEKSAAEASSESSAKKLSKKFSVEDYRTRVNSTQEAVSEGTHKAGSEERVSTESFSKNEITVDIKLPTEALTQGAREQGKTVSSENANSVTHTESFSQALAEQIARSSEDIVQAGKIVLRNNNEGSIRLQLHPANLGQVKILLELREGKKLSGKISVQSKEALSAFEESVQDLLAEFEKSGFETSGFELSLGFSEKDSSSFTAKQTHFGFLESYEDDLLLRSDEDRAEKVIGFAHAKAVNVLA